VLSGSPKGFNSTGDASGGIMQIMSTAAGSTTPTNVSQKSFGMSPKGSSPSGRNATAGAASVYHQEKRSFTAMGSSGQLSPMRNTSSFAGGAGASGVAGLSPISTKRKSTPGTPGTPSTPSGKLPRRHAPQSSAVSVSSPLTPRGSTMTSSDQFVEEIVSIEREMKSRNALGSRRRSRKNTPGTPATPTRKSQQQYSDDPFAEYNEQNNLVSNQGEGVSPKGFKTNSSPVLFDSIDAQQPLKLQYDPSQIRFGSSGSSTTGAKSLKDFKMMAETCNRAGKHRMEALAHYKLATMYEDLQKPAQAITHYRKFLHICQGLKDEVGTSLALNRLGVIFQILGGNENFKTALEYHIRHWEIADTQSKIVAHINMGLVFQYGSQDYENAGEHYRMAFQYALEIGDKQGESIALNNLGALGKDSGDFVTAQACIERHLLLSENMQDGRSATDAYQQLGMLASHKGNTENAVKMLNKARQIATINNDQSKANQIKCSIGIIEGNAKFDDYLKSIAQQVKSQYSYSNGGDDREASGAGKSARDEIDDLNLQDDEELTSFGNTPTTPRSHDM